MEKPTETAVLAWARLVRASQMALAAVEANLKAAAANLLALSIVLLWA